MKDLIISLIQCIASVEGVAYAAEDVGQLADAVFSDEKRMPVKYPCALVSVDMTQPTALKDGTIEDATIRISLADNSSVIASSSNEKNWPLAMRIYDVRSAVIRKMTDVGYTYKGTQKVIRDMGMRELDMTFKKRIEV